MGTGVEVSNVGKVFKQILHQNSMGKHTSHIKCINVSAERRTKRAETNKEDLNEAIKLQITMRTHIGIRKVCTCNGQA